MIAKNFKKDTRGSALVYVVITTAIILLFATITTAISYANYKISKMNSKSNDNFNNAELVVNAIVSGLEGDVSLAFKNAYSQLLTKVNTYPSNTTNDVIKKDFDRMFLEKINLILDSEQDEKYNMDIIQDYAQKVLSKDIRYSITATNGNNDIYSTENSIVLKNLHVTYEDDAGYYNEITTDITIKAPDFDLGFIINSTPLVNAISNNNAMNNVFYNECVDSTKLSLFVSEAVNAYNSGQLIGVELIENGIIITNADGAKAIVIDNKSGDPLALNIGSGIVIASGDIVVNEPWTGAIIVGGNITDNTGNNIIIDNNVIRNTLSLYFSYNAIENNGLFSMGVINIFNGYDSIDCTKINGEISNDIISECISLSNWETE